MHVFIKSRVLLLVFAKTDGKRMSLPDPSFQSGEVAAYLDKQRSVTEKERSQK